MTGLIKTPAGRVESHILGGGFPASFPCWDTAPWDAREAAVPSTGCVDAGIGGFEGCCLSPRCLQQAGPCSRPGRPGDHNGPFWITMDEVGALYEGNGEDGACSARASHAAELGLCLPLSEGISGRDGAIQTPCLSHMLKRGPGLPEVPQLWYANHFWVVHRAHASGETAPACIQTNRVRPKQPRKGMHIKLRFKGYKNNPFDLGVMFILFSVLTTNRQLKKCHLL